ncbi:MAG: bifunctional phosphopantothenoylcysteine decarboxylase/phosphopantothenate--cysteine ligase CoaBC [Lachnospiraceae bacterium]|nr:bifunctional phosphopantothenoylcysteine decarboxylase/phosphopantothenate--cysteine ligase CoaBC [Lachnospiraceae bacterium]MDY5742671.1 bifunctional phosphopantothenoylcysteine decarboxylase/phosphopantothenate--cysteine ligase CoaBC [Lachnospiraceae bacterium]
MSAQIAKKTIVIGVTGSIAAYKAAGLTSLCVKAGYDVRVIMTENAAKLIQPLTFETLTGHKCLTDTFDRNFRYDVEHISIAKQADAFVIAPATANVIGKIAGGIADDMLTTTVMAVTAPILIAPAMNTRMYENPIVQRNMNTLRELGCHFVEPTDGRLACGDIGKGKLAEPEQLFAAIETLIARRHTLTGKKVLVSAGPTREAIDPVRFISNHSTGTMGYALAREAALRGAEVTLISGPVSLTPPHAVDIVPVVSAAQMADAVLSRASAQDIIIQTAAVADFTPASPAASKIKKAGSEARSLELIATTDILKQLGEQKGAGQVLCGFAMETEELIANAETKLFEKHCDLLVANSLTTPGAGFGTATNQVSLLTPGHCEQQPLMDKSAVASVIMDRLEALVAEKTKCNV